MRRYWWTVWIKVAILAVALFFAFNAGKKLVVNMLFRLNMDKCHLKDVN